VNAFLAAVALAVPVFATTNVDDLLLLIAFSSDRAFRRRQVIIGQFCGMTAVILVSLACALVALWIPRAYIGLLGLLPFGIGVKKGREQRRARHNGATHHSATRHGATEEDEEEQITESMPSVRPAGHTGILSVAAVTFANGGDNISAYVPLFSARPRLEVALIIATFLVMTGIWCWLAQWLVHHEALGKYIRTQGSRLLPWVLMGLGLYLVASSNVLFLLLSLVLR
jgi:cadmium resistance protein CadD (predicted permease)